MSGIINGTQELKGNINEQQSLQGNVPMTIGVSPTINVIPIGNSHFVVINDINGMKTFTVKDGQDYVLTDKDKEDIASIFEYTKANAIKSNASGETILLTDSAEAPLQVQKVFGKSEQVGTPTVSAPIPIQSCGDSGSIVHKVLNGNLLDHSSQLYAGSDGSISYLVSMVSSVVDVRGIDSVYLSGDFALLDYGVTRIGLYDEKPLNLAQGLVGTRITTSASGVIDVSNCNYLLVGLLPAMDINSDAIKNSFMLNVGTSALPFEPYKEQPLILQTPNGLRGLKVENESEANYKDADGNLWACDYVDFERGKYVQRIVEGLIDGTVYGYVGGGVIQYSKKTVFGCEVLSTSSYEKDLKTYVLCDRYLMQSNSYNHSQVSGRMYFARLSDDIITVENSILETQDSAGRIKFFTEHPAKIYAVRKEPIETDLTEEEIAQYKALMTNYPNTTIINDANAYTEVGYVADTKCYIDNKFKEMTSAIAQLL